MQALLKRLYIGAVPVLHTGLATWLLVASAEPTLGRMLAAGSLLALPLRLSALFVLRQGRTPQRMPVFLGTAIVPAVAVVFVGGPGSLGLAVGAVLSSLGYVFWYSRLGRHHQVSLEVGQPLPEMEFVGPQGQAIRTADLAGRPVLLMFFRGNWCPLCMAQIREIAAQYRELAARGTEVLMVSPQAQHKTAALAKRFDAPMTFAQDVDGAVAKRLGLWHKNGLPLGIDVLGYEADTVFPTMLMADASGTLVFSDQSDNYRVRPEPGTFLGVLDGLDLGSKAGTKAQARSDKVVGSR